MEPPEVIQMFLTVITLSTSIDVLTITSTSTQIPDSLSTTITESTPSFLPLTTTFTPSPECSSYIVQSCSKNTCSVQARGDFWCAENSLDDHGTHCLPSSDSQSEPQYTYSPGKICPLGMTTAASGVSPDGVWCCPTDLPWAGTPPWCSTTLTRGSFDSSFACGLSTQSFSIIFGPNATQVFSLDSGRRLYTAAANTITVVASARGVFLMGQTMATASSTESVPIHISEDDDSSSSTLSNSVPIGVIIGCVVGVCILTGLVYFILPRRRQRHQMRRDGRCTTVNGAHHDHNPHNDDREAGPDVSVGATRSELEGTLGTSYGAGIYIQKPELEGTQGMSNVGDAVYVKNKAELEARPNQVAELEAIPGPVSRKKEAPPSSTIKIQGLGCCHRNQKDSRHELS
ncbi:hypothetical protein F4814DRAFT_444946 [Daldinia grandis]|nr:hypothetical protein F4814DRAFT_444946 [Daldinia grandis]